MYNTTHQGHSCSPQIGLKPNRCSFITVIFKLHAENVIQYLFGHYGASCIKRLSGLCNNFTEYFVKVVIEGFENKCKFEIYMRKSLYICKIYFKVVALESAICFGNSIWLLDLSIFLLVLDPLLTTS